MDILTDKGNNPLTNMNFLLQVDAVFDLPCRKISSFRQEMEYETIQEGGVNDYVKIRKKPVGKPFTFDVERYIGEKYFDPLPLGRQPILPILLYVSPYKNAGFENSVRIFCFTGCTVISKNYGEMNAENSGLLTETTTIAYQTVTAVKNLANI